MGLTARKAEKLSVLRSVQLEEKIVFTASVATKGYINIPCDGELVDVQVSQPVAGAGGTSISTALQKQTANVAMLGTAAVLTLAAGNFASVDARKKQSLPAGCTRPVITSTRSARRVKKGDIIEITVTPTGAYAGTFPTVMVHAHVNADT